MPAISVAFFCANACAQSSVNVSPPGSASRLTMLYPEWQPALNTIELVKSVVEAARSLVIRFVAKSAASVLLALKCPARKTTSWRRENSAAPRSVAFHEFSGATPLAAMSWSGAAPVPDSSSVVTALATSARKS